MRQRRRLRPGAAMIPGSRRGWITDVVDKMWINNRWYANAHHPCGSKISMSVECIRGICGRIYRGVVANIATHPGKICRGGNVYRAS